MSKKIIFVLILFLFVSLGYTDDNIFTGENTDKVIKEQIKADFDIEKEFRNVMKILEEISKKKQPAIETLYLGTKGEEQKKERVKLLIEWK